MEQFPFVLAGFHSDNGSEYINHRVAKMLNKLRVEQTKSRARHCNDNALAESKNASVVRKHMGYSHIPQQHAEPINAFYQTIFNPWLNLHRPCLFATETVNAKGKIVKRYKHANVKTPMECLTRLHAEKKVTLKKAVTIKALQAQANAQSDLVAAQLMQKAKARLFESFKKTAVKRHALGVFPALEQAFAGTLWCARSARCKAKFRYAPLRFAASASYLRTQP